MYRITRALSVGSFASLQRAERLRAAGVTHVFNVSNSPSQLCASEHGFEEVAWSPLEDTCTLPMPLMLESLNHLHRLASRPNAHVYVHCVYGQLRSPTILWLYLIACGVSPNEAREWIEKRSPDAAPGARRLANDSHILAAQKHGLDNFFPLPRGEVIVPVEPVSRLQ